MSWGNLLTQIGAAIGTGLGIYNAFIKDRPSRVAKREARAEFRELLERLIAGCHKIQRYLVDEIELDELPQEIRDAEHELPLVAVKFNRRGSEDIRELYLSIRLVVTVWRYFWKFEEVNTSGSRVLNEFGKVLLDDVNTLRARAAELLEALTKIINGDREYEKAYDF
jgi:hypothetical protein